MRVGDLVFVETNVSRLKSYERVVATYADVLPGVEFCAALTDNDVSR